MSDLSDVLRRTTLLHPWALTFLPVVAAAAILRARASRPAVLLAPLAAFDGPGGTPLPRSARQRFAALPAALGIAGLSLLAVALARPVEKVPLPVPVEGIDIVLALDVSSSMTARDPGGAGSRLDGAKEAAARFVAGRPADRIGLVAFARYPDVRCPPTGDHAALLRILADVGPVAPDGPEDATGLGGAAARAAALLRDAPGASRVVVLLTDGEENVSTSGTPGAVAPEEAAALARAWGVRVHAVRAGGDAGTTVPPPDLRPVRDLAARTGGRFYEARDAGALAAVYADIDALERTAAERERFDLRERFPPVALAALVLLLLGRLLGPVFPGTLP